MVKLTKKEKKKKVTTFIYIDAIIIKITDCKHVTEINQKIASTKNTFHSTRTKFSNPKLSLSTKLQTEKKKKEERKKGKRKGKQNKSKQQKTKQTKTYVLSTLVFACLETWILDVDYRKRLVAFLEFEFGF